MGSLKEIFTQTSAQGGGASAGTRTGSWGPRVFLACLCFCLHLCISGRVPSALCTGRL